MAVNLDHICIMQARVTASDGFGNTEGAFEEVFRDWGGLTYLRGGEGVIEARLTSRQPAILTLRNTAQARTVAPHWRVVANGRAFTVQEQPRLSDDRTYLECLVQSEPVGG